MIELFFFILLLLILIHFINTFILLFFLTCFCLLGNNASDSSYLSINTSINNSVLVVLFQWYLLYEHNTPLREKSKFKKQFLKLSSTGIIYGVFGNFSHKLLLPYINTVQVS